MRLRLLSVAVGMALAISVPLAHAGWTESGDVGAPILRNYDLNGNLLDHFSAADLYDNHGFVNGGSGIYYASSAHALDFVSNTDLGGIFKVLTENGLTEMTHASASAIGSAGGDPGSAGGDPGSAGGDPGFNLGGAAGGSDLYDPMGQKLNSSLGADPAFGTG